MVARYAGALPWASSGGRSAVFTRPAYQDPVRAVTGSRRGVPDVALSASFRGGFLSYGSFTGRGAWKPAGGTSVATPMLAGLVAIADQDAHTRLGLINPALYRLAQAHAPGIVPVTRGSNTVSFSQGGKTVTGARLPGPRRVQPGHRRRHRRCGPFRARAGRRGQPALICLTPAPTARLTRHPDLPGAGKDRGAGRSRRRDG